MTGCQVIQGDRTVSQYSSDSVITAKVKKKLIENKQVTASKVHVETDKGVVLLSGFVRTSKQKQIAGELAGAVKGVKNVKNSLTTYKEAHSDKLYYKGKRKLTFN